MKGYEGLDYRLNLGAWRKVFAVPYCIADEHHLKLASASQLRVLLYMLAYPDVGIREDIIASELGISKEDVADALLYWVNAQVIRSSGNEYYPAGIEASPVEKPEPKLAEKSVLSTPEARAALSSETHFPPKTIAGAVNESAAVKMLFQTYEKLAGRPPKHAEQQTLMILVEEIGLPCEVTMMLVEYCFNIDRATPAYMKTVAREWIDSGIDSLPKAEERIQQLKSIHSAENRLHKMFGMTSAFSSKQRTIISEWIDLGLSEELIQEAYDITLNNTGKLSFPYMDTILRKWHKDGIRSPSQIPENKPAAKPSDNAPSYSTSEIEQHALDKYKKLDQ